MCFSLLKSMKTFNLMYVFLHSKLQKNVIHYIKSFNPPHECIIIKYVYFPF